MHTQSEFCCQRQRSMFRANYQQIQGCFQLCSGWNESFPWAASESLLKQREHFLPILSDIHFRATKHQEMEGYIRYCPCCISSLVNTWAWFPCLSIWCFSPVCGNSSLSCIWFLPLPSILGKNWWRQNIAGAIKKKNIFSGHFSDNLVVCITFILESNHSLSRLLICEKNALFCYWLYPLSPVQSWY